MTVSTTDVSIAPLKGVFELNAQLMWKAIEDVSEEHRSARSNETVNSFHWLLGHITAARFAIARTVGIDAPNPFGDHFKRGESAPGDDGFPAISEIREKFDAITKKIAARLSEISAGELQAATENEFPSQEKTVLGALGFWQFHESVHVGQLMLLRRVFGYSGLVG